MNNQLLSAIQRLNFTAPLPSTLIAVRQSFDVPEVTDIEKETIKALEVDGLLAKMKPGASVGVGVGSRGIANIARITRATVARLKLAGMHPFVFPAMGSHGGATAEGQIAVLNEYGVTEEYVGCEIRATMEVKVIGQIPDGPTLYQGLDSAAADHCLILSRIKLHTDFRSDLESGPSKMVVIGLGKQHGAAIMHTYAGPGFQRFLAPAARIYETNTNCVGAIGIIENAYEKTGEILGITADKIGSDVEREALKRARRYMASIPFAAVDCLVVRELGKNISGAGMDPNILNRLMVVRENEPGGAPDVATIAVLDLTHETQGNSSGLGLSNATTLRVLNKIDWYYTYMNGLTSGTFGMYRMSVPVVCADDYRAISAVVRGCGNPKQDQAKIMLINNTLELAHFWVSPSLRAEVEAHPRLSIEGEVPFTFGTDGNMISPWAMK
jgi:hypothetical protein